jgi:hypothetical protein
MEESSKPAETVRRAWFICSLLDLPTMAYLKLSTMRSTQLKERE